jgi:hypothetical protein
MNIDRQRLVESKREQRRRLAELPGLKAPRDDGMRVESRSDQRRKLAELQPGEKLRVLDGLQARAQILRGTRRAKSPKEVVNDNGTKTEESAKGGRGKKNASPTAPLRFGGRATSAGVNYECRIAAFYAVKMLGGERCSIGDGVTGADVVAIMLQTADAVDDVVMQLRTNAEARIFISAKLRNSSITLSEKNETFTTTVAAFVRQFLQIPIEARAMSRLVWAIPSAASQAAARDLPYVLDSHRRDAGDDALAGFIARRQIGERTALQRLVALARKEWKCVSKRLPTNDEIRAFLRVVYVETFDFEIGGRLERDAEGELRTHVLEKPGEALRAWRKLEHHFGAADQRGNRLTASFLRRILVADGFVLKAPPDFAPDIKRLQEQTAQNLLRLKEHTVLRFGRAPADEIHIDRSAERAALLSAINERHLLLTGDPGCGKSGLIADVIEDLQKENRPTVLLLAEEIFSGHWEPGPNLPGFGHALDEILAQWPNGARGVLITDALDAVRDAEKQKMLRGLLRTVQRGQSGWTVLASVREYDLKHGRELREAFPGDGVPNHSLSDFAGIAHFHLAGLTEGQLDDLAKQRADIRPFVENARGSVKSGGIHRSPFYLRLAAELLCNDVTPARLADLNSPAVLLRRFWEVRVASGAGAESRELALRVICQRMLETRSMILSAKELNLGATELNALRELRSRGIFQTPALRHGDIVGEEKIQFTHHLLHDYAIARAVVPTTKTRFCEFVKRDPLLAVFYRQSFLFALEELWDVDPSREEFWQSALQLEAESQLHGITRILAPLLAARRVESPADLQPVMTAVESSANQDSPGHRALRHLASGLQDASDGIIRSGVTGWYHLARRLAERLAADPSVELALVQIFHRLIQVGVSKEQPPRQELNMAARLVLKHHLKKPVDKAWVGAGMVAIEGTCRTFDAAPAESEASLLELLTPERLAQFPHNDLHELADELTNLGNWGNVIVVRLFEAAFGVEPAPGSWVERGSAIMGMRFQTSDEWNMVHYTLAGYYENCAGQDVGLLTDLACIAWNAAVRRRSGSRERSKVLLATMQFRGVQCELLEDYSHIWGREFEHEENRILSRFESWLQGWAESGDGTRLEASLDRFLRRNRTSLLWNVFLEAAAKHPPSLGNLLEPVLDEPVFLSHPDYVYAGTALLGALHRMGDAAHRERLEKLVLDLPTKIRPHSEEDAESIRRRGEYAQNRLLKTLEEPNIVLPAVRSLRAERAKADTLVENKKSRGPQVTSRTLSPAELIAEGGVDLKQPANSEMFQMREALKPLLDRDNQKTDKATIERNWHVVAECEKLIAQHRRAYPKMAADLWGHLVGACENIVRHAAWPKGNSRWQKIREILLKAARDPEPKGREESKDDGWPSWGWPAPRLDAARGLPFLSYRMGKLDPEIAAALRRFCVDKSHPLRFNFADRLGLLEHVSPDIMWELIDSFIKREKKFSVLEMVIVSLNRLSSASAPAMLARLRAITDRAKREADADNHIHETIAHTYLFRFLRTGDPECERFITALIDECDTERGSKALGPQLHACRQGGWLTAGDAITIRPETEAVRSRTWDFFSQLLAASQRKLGEDRAALERLHAAGQIESDAGKATKAKIERTMRLVDGIAMQLFFASGAHEEKSNKNAERLNPAQLRRFWSETSSLFSALAAEPHPHTANQIVETLYHLLPCSPREVFLLACLSIMSSSEAGLQHESLAVGNVVKLIERALADHRELFQPQGAGDECFTALLRVLDLFVEAGWAEARRLTHRLEEINR